MYKLKRYELTKKDGSYEKFIHETMANTETEEDREAAKELIFRLTYPWALNYVKKFKNLGQPEDFSGDMSIAFMKTFNNYDAEKEGTSFLKYYKMAMRSEIVNNYYGKYRMTEEGKALVTTAKNLMSYLDEPLYNKEEKETGTKKDLLTDEEVDFDANLVEEDYKNEIKALAWEALQSREHKRNTEIIYMYYIDRVLEGEFTTYSQLARELGKPITSVRKAIVDYNKTLEYLLIKRGYTK